MPDPKLELEPYPSFKHLLIVARFFGLHYCKIDSDQKDRLFHNAILCDRTRLWLAAPGARTKTWILPRINNIRLSPEYEAGSGLRRHYDEIVDIGEMHFSWFRIAAVFSLSGFAANNAAMERKLCDFAAISKVMVPYNRLLDFVVKWHQRPFNDLYEHAAKKVVEEFYDRHPELMSFK